MLDDLPFTDSVLEAVLNVYPMLQSPIKDVCQQQALDDGFLKG
jgi:hypothetical protein